MTAEPHAFRDTSHREFVTLEPKEQQMYIVAVPLQGGEPGREGAACQCGLDSAVISERSARERQGRPMNTKSSERLIQD
jgi:hypothetical protein